MRAKRIIYLMSMFLIAALASCQRRPLETADFTVRVNIEIDDNIVNYQMPSLPNLMRCIFYDAENGNFVTQAFLPRPEEKSSSSRTEPMTCWFTTSTPRRP